MTDSLKKVTTKKRCTTPGLKQQIVPLAQEHACYIVIVCKNPSVEGTMDVEMTYEGDPMLASYLLSRAQGFIEDNQD